MDNYICPRACKGERSFTAHPFCAAGDESALISELKLVDFATSNDTDQESRSV